MAFIVSHIRSCTNRCANRISRGVACRPYGQSFATQDSLMVWKNVRPNYPIRNKDREDAMTRMSDNNTKGLSFGKDQRRGAPHAHQGEGHPLSDHWDSSKR